MFLGMGKGNKSVIYGDSAPRSKPYLFYMVF